MILGNISHNVKKNYDSVYNSLACEDDPELRAVGQVQLLEDVLTGGHVAGSTSAADQGLRHQVVESVDVKDLPYPPVQTTPSKWMACTSRVGTNQPHLPQPVWHPQQERMGEKPVWGGSLVVQQGWRWRVVPELQVVTQLQLSICPNLKESSRHPLVVLLW